MSESEGGKRRREAEGASGGVRQRGFVKQRGKGKKEEEKELKLGQGQGVREKKFDKNGTVLDLGEPGQNRFNRSGSRFWRLNRRFLVFDPFFHFSGFFREPDRIRHRSPVEPVEPAGPVRFLKP